MVPEDNSPPSTGLMRNAETDWRAVGWLHLLAAYPFPLEPIAHPPLALALSASVRCRDPSRWKRPIRTAMQPTVQIGKPTLQPGFILLPCHPIHARCSLAFQRTEAVLSRSTVTWWSRAVNFISL